MACSLKDQQNLEGDSRKERSSQAREGAPRPRKDRDRQRHPVDRQRHLVDRQRHPVDRRAPRPTSREPQGLPVPISQMALGRVQSRECEAGTPHVAKVQAVSGPGVGCGAAVSGRPGCVARVTAAAGPLIHTRIWGLGCVSLWGPGAGLRCVHLGCAH